jgi:hypothetical protein
MKNIPTFISLSFVDSENKKHEADAQTKTLFGTADCKIGNFYENWFVRTKAACKKDFKGYGSLENYKKAITLSLKKRGCSEIIFN